MRVFSWQPVGFREPDESPGSKFGHCCRGSAIFHPEDRARNHIDASLAAAGWVVQSRAQMNLGAGLGVAVREFAMGSGPVDYALFVGRDLCGLVVPYWRVKL